MAEPMAPVDDEQAETEGSGFCVEIHFNPDGSIKVGVEPLEEAAEEESEQSYQTVPDIQAALKLIQQIYAQQGQTQTKDQAAQSMGEGYGS